MLCKSLTCRISHQPNNEMWDIFFIFYFTLCTSQLTARKRVTGFLGAGVDDDDIIVTEI